MLSRRLGLALLLCLPSALTAQRAASTVDPWTLRLRATLSGASDDSDPGDYKIYSGIALEAALARRLGAAAAVELSARTESREVLGPDRPGEDNRLGSLEMLPVTLLARWLPRGRSAAALQPYVAAGAALTATWEKSGALDSTDVPATLSPAVGFGTDYALSPRTVLSLDVKWNPMTARITHFRAPDPRIRIDPLTLGLGLGVRL